jgi:hypothetical protein
MDDGRHVIIRTISEQFNDLEQSEKRQIETALGNAEEAIDKLTGTADVSLANLLEARKRLVYAVAQVERALADREAWQELADWHTRTAARVQERLT